jgi:hypothetical protein
MEIGEVKHGANAGWWKKMGMKIKRREGRHEVQ